MKILKLLGWIYIICSLIVVLIALFDKISLSRTMLYGIAWSDFLLIALMTRQERPKDFSKILFITFIFFLSFIAALLLEYA